MSLPELVDQRNAMDIIYLDFNKVFDKLDHSLLLGKIEQYGTDSITTTWI